MDTRVRRARRIDAQDLFVQTLEQWADAVVVIDDQSRVLFINAAAERFWGCPRQDVVGSHVDTLFPETLRTADDPGSSRDLSILGKDGQMRWATLSVSRITQKGRPLHVAFLKDITQTRLQDIEHRLLSLSVNATRSATCIVDAAARLVYVNDGLLQLLGYSREEVLGLSPLRFFVLDTEV